MSFETQDLKSRSLEASDADRRRHNRVDLKLKARFLRVDGSEEPCLVVNISAGGALLKAMNPPLPGESIIIYIDNVGRFDASVIRAGRYSFAVDYRGRRAKTARTADSLTFALNNSNLNLDRREHPRIRQEAPARITLETGEVVACAILDISLTGASVAIDPRPPLGAYLTVGRMPARVVRRHEHGVGVVFTSKASGMEEVIEKAKSHEFAPLDGAVLADPVNRKGG